MAEAALGEGRVLIWAGGFDLDRTNLARTPRFVPLLHESLRDLIGTPHAQVALSVGDAAPKGREMVRLSPDAGSVDAHIDLPGIYRDASMWTPAEFEIRMCDAPVLVRDGKRVAVDAQAVRWEYGLWVLGLLAGLLLVEQIYAARIGQAQRESIG